jgi:hypothetical protein
MKATVQEYDFHQRIFARDDPIAFVQLVESLYLPLVQDVQQRAGSQADPILVEEAVGQALLDYHDTPAHYDPNRANLRSYLAMAAYRDFQNAQAKEQRVQSHQISLFDPTLQESVCYPEFLEPDGMIASQTQAEQLWQCVQDIFCEPVERRIASLIIHGVDAPEPYAQILGLAGTTHKEQIKHIRLVKYRITRRLRRRVAQQLRRIEGDDQL